MLLSRFRSSFEPAIIKLLTVQGGRIADKARRNASWSSSIPSSITVGKAQKVGNTRYEIEIRVDSSEDGDAPHAIAFEYGSGEHGEGGSTYEIRPKDANYLAFDWQPEKVPWGRPKFFGAILKSQEGTKGRYFFNWVDHPGVEARPYMNPAVDSEKENQLFEIADAFVEALTGVVTEVIIIDGK